MHNHPTTIPSQKTYAHHPTPPSLHLGPTQSTSNFLLLDTKLVISVTHIGRLSHINRRKPLLLHGWQQPEQRGTHKPTHWTEPTPAARSRSIDDCPCAAPSPPWKPPPQQASRTEIYTRVPAPTRNKLYRKSGHQQTNYPLPRPLSRPNILPPYLTNSFPTNQGTESVPRDYSSPRTPGLLSIEPPQNRPSAHPPHTRNLILTYHAVHAWSTTYTHVRI